MRRGYYLLLFQKWISRGWLFCKHVYCRSGNFPICHCPGKSCLVYDPTSGAIHNPDTRPHNLELVFVYQVPSLVGQGSVHCNEIAVPEDLFKGCNLNPELVGLCFCHKRIVGQDLHAKSFHPSGNFGTYTAQANYAQGLVVEFNARVLFPVPLALMEGSIGLRDISGHSQHHGYGVLCSGYGVAAGSVQNYYALFGSRLYIDVVYTYACSSYHLELICGVDDFRSHLCAAAYYKGIVVFYLLDQLFRGKVGYDVNLRSGFEPPNSFLCK